MTSLICEIQKNKKKPLLNTVNKHICQTGGGWEGGQKR